MAETFHSILFDGVATSVAVPEGDSVAALRDLNLDQLISALVEGRDEYDLATFFRSPLPSAEAVGYRHEVFRDLGDEPILTALNEFALAMRTMRHHTAQLDLRYYDLQKQRWLLDAVAVYCAAVRRLRDRLEHAEPRSRGLRSVRDYLDGHLDAETFRTLAADTDALLDDLAAVEYCVTVTGNRVRVTTLAEERDYAAEVSETFARFRQGVVKDYRVELPDTPEMNQVEGRILDFVAHLHSEPFERLAAYCRRNTRFADPTIVRFDREIQFYLAYHEQMQRLRAAGLPFCYPRVCDTAKEEEALEAFDLVLANKLVADGLPVVCNGWQLARGERILVVTGPNQGGKTTFARTFGQLHYLAALGCPVPGRAARLLLFDQVLTHFEREEDLASLSGKLEADLRRIHDILALATDRSIVVMNESFSATTLADARLLGTRVLEQLIEREALAVYVTFVDELASLDEAIVSMMSTVDPDDPAVRTFRVVRKQADGLAYAAALAEKHNVSYGKLSARLVR